MTTTAGGDTVVVGRRCGACGYVTATTMPRCPLCHGGLDDARFPATGVVWSSTVIRIPVGGRVPPYTVAYVDLEDGPRVLAHVRGAAAARVDVGSHVEVCGLSPTGDLEVEVR